MKKILAADLFCGALRKAEFFGTADAAVDQRVMRWAEHPEHVSLAQLHGTPCAIPLELRFMGDVEDSAFAASWNLANARQGWKPFIEALNERILPAFRGIPSLRVRVRGFELFGRSPLRLQAALNRAVAAIRAHLWCQCELGPACFADAPLLQPMLWRRAAAIVLRVSAARVRAVASGDLDRLELRGAVATALASQNAMLSSARREVQRRLQRWHKRILSSLRHG